MQDDKESALQSTLLPHGSGGSSRSFAEEELRQAKANLECQTHELDYALALMHATLEATTDAILVTQGLQLMTHCNGKYIKMWGLTPELIGSRELAPIMKACSRFFAEPQEFLDRITRIFTQAPAESYDLLELTDGRSIERRSSIQFIEGARVGRVWSFHDVSNYKRAERALREETQVLELINETGIAIASKLELLSLLQTITDAATQLSGALFGAFFYTARDDQGQTLQLYTLSGKSQNIFGQFPSPRETPLFSSTFRGEAPIRSDDITQHPLFGQLDARAHMPAGHPVVKSYLAVPVISRQGTVMGGLFFGHHEAAVFTDRAERIIVGLAAQAAVAIDNARLYEDVKKAAIEREHLLEAERAARTEAERVSRIKDEFLSTLSHELRTPLNAILGWAEILQYGIEDSDDFKLGLETIERNARAQTRLIEDLLDMSRIITGKVRLDIQTVELGAIIEASLETLRPSTEAKGMTIIQDLKLAPHLNVLGDPKRLQQIIWNLLSNAIKFTPARGTVEILARLDGDGLELHICDSGLGIDPDFLPFVFDRFRQADSSSTRRFGGLGIGLSIVKQLVELHGGSIRAASSGVGCGSQFILGLPLARASASPFPHDSTLAPQRPQAPAALLKDLKILVIDDEADARELIRKILIRYQAQVITAASAAEGVRLFQELQPHIVVSDIGMPDQDGYVLIRELRRLEAQMGRHTPAIALTAFASSEDRTRAILAGYQMHLSKPVDSQELVVTLASLARIQKRS